MLILIRVRLYVHHSIYLPIRYFGVVQNYMHRRQIAERNNYTITAVEYDNFFH